jgi:uncharacterized protein YndB with AHSA1/START domain/DNA-binding transcriptional ArsR family regulator
MDPVFRALADPSRRALLDALREQDGRTLGQLCEVLPDLTRFGVAKHLGVCEEAGLITTRKVGRSKHHYLNPVPIQDIADRWIDRYRAPSTRMLVDFRDDLEQGKPLMSSSAPTYVQSVHIQAPAPRVWEALVDPAFTRRYYYGFGLSIHGDLASGTSYAYEDPDRGVGIVGEIVEVDEPTRLVMTFAARWDESVSRDERTRVTFELEPLGSALTRLTMVHDGFVGATPTFTAVSGGWGLILDGLKTLLETGAPLQVPQAAPPLVRTRPTPR